MSRQEVLDVLLEMRLCRNGLVQTPEQLRFSLYALTVAMSSMDFTTSRANHDTSKPEHQTNGIKLDSDPMTNATDRLRQVSIPPTFYVKAAFSYKRILQCFSLLTILLCNFLAKEY